MMEKLREALEVLNGRNYLVPWDLEERLAEEEEHSAWLAVTEAARRVLDAPTIDWCMTHSGVPRWCPADVEHVVVPARLITEETE